LTTAIACTFPFTHTHNYETYTLSLHDALPIYISAHQSCEPPFKTGFGCGNFLRRRRRIQLFQVLRTLSRGVRYCSLSSLLFTSWVMIPRTEKSSVFKMVWAVPMASAWWASLAAVMGRPRIWAYLKA